MHPQKDLAEIVECSGTRSPSHIPSLKCIQERSLSCTGGLSVVGRVEADRREEKNPWSFLGRQGEGGGVILTL